ncbi:MAG: hypothetical protein VZQ80_01725 [Lachnospiraceae bacterium]|nr:hypothetical protein [Lachnospiraceae bacterium]
MAKTKIDYENWDEHAEENLAVSGDVVMLDAEGKIDLENESDGSEDETLPYRGAAVGSNGEQLYDVTDPGNAMANKENVPSSGIVLNRNYLYARREKMDAAEEKAVADPFYPDVVQFVMTDDIGDGSSATELAEELSDLYEALAVAGDADGMPDEFDLYDGLIGNGETALTLHVHVRGGSLQEVYLTLEKGEADEEADFFDFGEGEVFDPASPDLVPEDEGLAEAFANYITNTDPMNCETLPLSFAAYYLKSHAFSRWAEYLGEAVSDPFVDFFTPVYVKQK